MTHDERKAEFLRLFKSIPGRNVDRVRRVCAVLHCRPVTVYIWKMQSADSRACPEAKLRILARELARDPYADPAPVVPRPVVAAPTVAPASKTVVVTL